MRLPSAGDSTCPLCSVGSRKKIAGMTCLSLHTSPSRSRRTNNTAKVGPFGNSELQAILGTLIPGGAKGRFPGVFESVRASLESSAEIGCFGDWGGTRTLTSAALSERTIPRSSEGLISFVRPQSRPKAAGVPQPEGVARSTQVPCSAGVARVGLRRKPRLTCHSRGLVQCKQVTPDECDAGCTLPRSFLGKARRSQLIARHHTRSNVHTVQHRRWPYAMFQAFFLCMLGTTPEPIGLLRVTF